MRNEMKDMLLCCCLLLAATAEAFQHGDPSRFQSKNRDRVAVPLQTIVTANEGIHFQPYSSSSSTTTTRLYLAAPDKRDESQNDSKETNESGDKPTGGLNKMKSPASRKSASGIRTKVKELAKKFLDSTSSSSASSSPSMVPMPRAIAKVLQDASMAALEEVEDLYTKERISSKQSDGKNEQHAAVKSNSLTNSDGSQLNSKDNKMIQDLVEEAFAPMEASLHEMEDSLRVARKSLDKAKKQSFQVVEALQLAALAQVEGASVAVAQAEQDAERKVLLDLYSNSGTVGTATASDGESIDVSSLSFRDLDFESSEMAPPFLDPDSCLIPGEPVIRVEKAPENSRRIFAGVDILASVDDVWKVLTDYANLQNVVPNLVRNDVLSMYDAKPVTSVPYDQDAPEEVQCKRLAEQMKGSVLKQVGGAKVAGINFAARTTVEVREWPQGLPDFAHFKDDMWEGKSRFARAKEYPTIPLKRYRFPRPFALSSLPTRDISMQSIVNDDGEFRLYQGVWRMQPLPGCAPPGKQAMRLSYAVEISPRAYLPVRLVEGRIVKDLCTNLEAIRNAVSESPAVSSS